MEERALENIIQNRMGIIDDLKEELDIMKEEYEEFLEKDSEYMAIEEQQEKVREEKRMARARLKDNSTYSLLREDMKEKRKEISENRQILSQDLVDLYKREGKVEITTPTGEVKRMKFKVRLVNG